MAPFFFRFLDNSEQKWKKWSLDYSKILYPLLILILYKYKKELLIKNCK